MLVAGGPDQYVVFSTEIGDAVLLHGVIALTILARAEEVSSGAFRCDDAQQPGSLAMGVSLGPMGHAANKGVAALLCRYYDASLLLMAAHLAADKAGSQRERRYADTHRALRSLSSTWGSPEFDAHLQAHHSTYQPLPTRPTLTSQPAGERGGAGVQPTPGA